MCEVVVGGTVSYVNCKKKEYNNAKSAEILNC